MHRNKSVDVHQFAMVPRAEIPRSSFKMEKGLKTTFDSGYLVPIFCEEVLPGDTFSVSMTGFARLATPIFPTMDNLHCETFFFFCPNRLVWKNWRRFMGEQANPGDSTDFTIPQAISPVGGWPVGSIGDHFGLPTVGQVAAASRAEHSALPLRMYNFIFNEWFRDQNLVPASWGFDISSGDGPDLDTNFFLRRRGKRHDYFTSALPWVQKGESVTLPLGTSAPVLPSNDVNTPSFKTGAQLNRILFGTNGSQSVDWNASSTETAQAYWDNPGLYADLSAATAATINQLRQSFQIQKLLERDARGGTRYTEIIRSHFGVISPDARLNRPEYLGGGHSVVTMNPIAQTSATATDGTPLGELAAFATTTHRAGFSQSFTEHGYIIGLVNVRADLSYQQGLRKHWMRKTRYDFYFPAFAMLGEQAITAGEIFYTGVPAQDDVVFGYQERWAELRYNPSEIHGLFRSTASGTLDAWHYAQHFLSVPTLNQTFIEEAPPLERTLAVGSEALGYQLIMDAFYEIKAARPLPLYSVPGMVDHF